MATSEASAAEILEGLVGEVGEDVAHNLRTMPTIPLRISDAPKVLERSRTVRAAVLGLLGTMAWTLRVPPLR